MRVLVYVLTDLLLAVYAVRGVATLDQRTPAHRWERTKTGE
jgi:hypothetical protein